MGIKSSERQRGLAQLNVMIMKTKITSMPFFLTANPVSDAIINQRTQILDKPINSITPEERIVLAQPTSHPLTDLQGNIAMLRKKRLRRLYSFIKETIQAAGLTNASKKEQLQHLQQFQYWSWFEIRHGRRLLHLEIRQRNQIIDQQVFIYYPDHNVAFRSCFEERSGIIEQPYEAWSTQDIAFMADPTLWHEKFTTQACKIKAFAKREISCLRSFGAGILQPETCI